MRAAGGQRQEGRIKLATCVCTRNEAAEWWKVCRAFIISFGASARNDNDDNRQRLQKRENENDHGARERCIPPSIHARAPHYILYISPLCVGAAAAGVRGCWPFDDDDGERAGVAGEGGGGRERETQCASLWDAESYSSCWEAVAPPAHRSSASAPSTSGGGSTKGWTSQGEYNLQRCIHRNDLKIGKYNT